MPVHLDVWEGLIWLSLADDPGPVSAQLEPALRDRFGELEKFRRYDVGSLAVGRSITYEIAANWKLVVENFMECYHCAPVHPVTSLLPDFRLGTSYQGIVGQGTAFADDIDAFTLSGRGERAMLPVCFPPTPGSTTGSFSGPTSSSTCCPTRDPAHADSAGTGALACRLRLVVHARRDRAAGVRPTDTVAVFDITNRQDWDVCERTQLGMRSRAFVNGGLYVTNEQHIAVPRSGAGAAGRTRMTSLNWADLALDGESVPALLPAGGSDSGVDPGRRARAGAQLPAERELAERTGISRMTARQALADLARGGDVAVEP